MAQSLDDFRQLPAGPTPDEVDVDITDEEVEELSSSLEEDDVEDDFEEEDGDFGENLALVWSEETLDRIGMRLNEDIDHDKDARKKRDKQYEEGLKRTGMGEDAPGGAEFQGADKTTHPVITTCTIDFASRAIKEVFPPEGPVKTYIAGTNTKERLERADRIRRHMNVQLTRTMKEFRAELEQLLTQLPLGGSQYLKMYWDRRLRRPRAEFIPIDEVFLPFRAAGLDSADRVTHEQVLTDIDFSRRVKSGLYRDIDVTPDNNIPESDSERANNKIEGKEDSGSDDIDDPRVIREVYTYLDEEEEIYGSDDNNLCPYIVSIDDRGKVLAVYRNWDKGDDTYQALDWLVEFVFIPWRGAYGAGLPHLIGGLAASATGALRALLDSAHINNAPTLLKLKGGRIGGQSQTISITQVNEVEGAPGVDDIRKIAMPMPFNPPSPILYQLLGTLDNLARGVVRTALEDSPSSSSETPVGTELSRVENGMVVFSAIHTRLHNSMRKCLEILFRLNSEHLDDQEVLDDFGEFLATRGDYEGPMDVMPISDPHIFSEAQRFAKNQLVVQLASMYPKEFEDRKIVTRILDTSKIPAYQELLSERPEPTEQNSAAENVQMAMGQPATAFPDQDHLAHLQVHLQYLQDPMFGGSPLIAPTFTPSVLEHIKQHLNFWYAQQMVEIISEASGVDFTEVPYSLEGYADDIDQLLAKATVHFHGMSGKALENVPPVIERAMQMMQQSGQQPQDPAMLAAQAAMIDAQSKAKKVDIDREIKEGETQLEARKLETEESSALINKEIESAKLAMQKQVETYKVDKNAETELLKSQLNARVALTTAKMQNGSREAGLEMPGDDVDFIVSGQPQPTTSDLINAITQNTQNSLLQIVTSMNQQNQALVAALTAPRVAIMDAEGNIVGSRVEG